MLKRNCTFASRFSGFLTGTMPLFCFFVLSGVSAGVEIDRLLVSVNGNVITESDFALARRINAIITYDTNVEASREEEINRLIDLELMRQELRNFSISQEDETRVEARMQTLREAYSRKGGLSSLLRHLGLQEAELISYFKLESSILKFVDFRFRPFVTISEAEIKHYYDSRLTSQLRQAGLELPALAQVSARIEEILREEKVNLVLEQWIKDIRANSRIEYYGLDGK